MDKKLYLVTEAFDDNNIFTAIRCGYHTLQLAVTDSLAMTKNIKETLSSASKLAKKLRTPSIRKIFKSHKLKGAILECVTRWGSTYDMLERLLELKDFCQEFETGFEVLRLSETK